MTLSFFRSRGGGAEKGSSTEEELGFFFFIKWGYLHLKGKDRKLKPHNSKLQNHNNLCCRLKSYHLQIRYLGDVIYILHLHYYYFSTFPGVSSFHTPLQYCSSPVFFMLQKFYHEPTSPLGSVGAGCSVSLTILEIRCGEQNEQTSRQKMANDKTTQCHLRIFF